MSERLPQLAIRVKPEFRDEITDIAAKHFGGNESELFRFSVRLVIDLRRKFGHRFEPVIHELMNGEGTDLAA